MQTVPFDIFRTSLILQYADKNIISNEPFKETLNYINNFALVRDTDNTLTLYYLPRNNNFNYDFLMMSSENFIEHFFLLMSFTKQLPYIPYSSPILDTEEKIMNEMIFFLILTINEMYALFKIGNMRGTGSYGFVQDAELNTSTISIYYNYFKNYNTLVLKFYTDITKESIEEFCKQYQKIKHVTCNSSNVIAIYFTISSTLNYVMGMERLDGTLNDCTTVIVDTNKITKKKDFIVLSLYDYINMFIQLINVLKCLHEHNIYHKDIKPENIGIRRKQSGGYDAVLFDFDLSCGGLGDECKSMGGTPVYLSPERFFKLNGYRNYNALPIENINTFTNGELSELDDNWALAFSFYSIITMDIINDPQFKYAPKIKIPRANRKSLEFLNMGKLIISIDPQIVNLLNQNITTDTHAKALYNYFTLLFAMLNLDLDRRERVRCLDLKSYGLDDIDQYFPSKITFF